ncbi:MAG TPA: molybdate ABC transporter substrate-binding protein [Lachnospiraceae bacterium]|nr:molybdate ABC transporter substrate-binding protein [Lachnospiraceae bacterium]
MRKFKLFALSCIFLLVLFALGGCSKDDSKSQETSSTEVNENTNEESSNTDTSKSDNTSTDSTTTDTTTATSDNKEDSKADSTKEGDKTSILVAAASSLQYCMEEELEPMFEKANPGVDVTFTFDSSGKLQTQIEEGADVDVFMSAAMKQMDTLNGEGLMDKDSIVELLENKIVLIAPAGADLKVTGFEDITKADTIALGDPESVPVGQYSKEAFENLGTWEEVKAKASFGTNVTEVLNWVAEGSADVGVVYATDADTTDQVKVVAQVPSGSVSKAIYPVGIVSASTKKEAAQLFVDFLSTKEALDVFVKYGFTINK